MFISSCSRLVLVSSSLWRAPYGIRCLASEASVSGVVYSGPADAPTVKLYTKAGCTLCDVAKDVLKQAAEQQPHTLEAVDITDEEHAGWWDKYKYDIPVLHIDDMYWAKHRISLEDSQEALKQAASEGLTLEGKAQSDAGCSTDFKHVYLGRMGVPGSASRQGYGRCGGDGRVGGSSRAARPRTVWSDVTVPELGLEIVLWWLGGKTGW